ncbi:NAD(P)H-dependent oxidoreductase [Hoeflea sp. TYP-13]|uniref:NAD(P)H-dependent oxidoreductase n=1 Tax=Hoeflea sp. TYP-13 TaxID=3230023 RepID=UPI0034C5B3D3
MTETTGSSDANVLVVSCHPLADSLCAQLREHILVHLSKSATNVTHLDLYAAGFDPVLSPDERAGYHAKPYPTDAVGQEAADLSAADILILVFPVWWFGFPAMLKGWFDRVWVPGVAYDHADNAGPIKPRLLKLRQCVAVTTMGSPWWIDRFILFRPVRRILARALIGACAPKCRFNMLTHYAADSADKNSIDRFKGRVDKVLASIL